MRNNLRSILYLSLTIALLGSCVSTKKYDALMSEKNQLEQDLAASKKNAEMLASDKAKLESEKMTLSKKVDAVEDELADAKQMASKAERMAKDSEAKLDQIVALPDQGLAQGTRIMNIAVFLSIQGHFEAARTTIERAIQWLDARVPETKSTQNWRLYYAWALYIANRCDQAYGVASPLSQEFPENFDYRGLVGLIAACLGDREEALEVSQWLESLDRPYLRGSHTAWRSLIAAALGDGESAVALRRQASAEGWQRPRPFSWGSIGLEPIRDYEPWQELIGPKG